MKRIFVFVLAAVLLVGAVPAKEVKAEETLMPEQIFEYYNLSACDYSCLYFVFLKFSSDSEQYYFYFFEEPDLSVSLDGNYILFKSDSYWQRRFQQVGSSSWVSKNGTGLSICYDSLFDVLYSNFDIEYGEGIDSTFDEGLLEYYGLGSHEHSWTTQTESATCATVGSTWEECECGAVQNEVEIPALGHSWEEKEDVGSCIEDSKTWEECSVCGAIQNEVVTPASGHVWVEKIEAATCTTTGKSWEECGCGEIQNEIELPLVDHSWINKTDPATCTETGKAWEECSVCFEVRNERVVEALGHGILIYEVTQEPTISDPGTFTRTCSVCGEIVESGVIPAVTPTPTPRPTATPRPTSTPRPTATPRPTSTPRPTATPRPGVTITPRPTVTPRPTATPKPSPTPRVTFAPVDPDVINDNVIGLLGVLMMIMELFIVFPLNVYLISGIIILVIGIYILLKNSTKKR